MDFAELIFIPPISTLFVLLISVTMSTFTAFVTSRVTDQSKLRRYRKEIAEWRQMMATAKKTGDEKLALEVRRRSKIVQNMQKQVATQGMKPTLIFFVPFLVIWAILSGLYGSRIVAYAPFNLRIIPLVGLLISPGSLGINLFGWYLLCNFSIGTIINRLFGVNQVAGLSPTGGFPSS
ncbi:MAG: EMC3/TMCO1 family protein [Promethearchaeati archaeon SRVP18_Atabeyarchaeia-1]